MIAVAFLFQACTVFSLGALILARFGKKGPLSWTLAVPMGYLALFTVYEILALPLTLLQVPLRVLTVLLALCMAAAIGCALYFCRPQIQEMNRRIPSLLSKHGIVMAVLAGCVLLQLWIVLVYVDYSVDAGYYIAKSATDAYTNTIGFYSPTTGATLHYLNVRYLTACFPDYNAAMAQLFGISAILQAKKIVPLISVVVSNMIIYRTGLALFKRNPRLAGLFTFFWSIIRYWSGTLYTDGTFFFTRTYEGKALLAGIIIPAALYAYLVLWQDPSRTELRIMLICTSIAGVCFSSTSLILLPFLLGAGSLTLWLRRRNRREFFWAVLTLLPVVLALGLYLLFKMNILSAAIRR